MGIPVFHDDQHGTAIIVSAAVRNALLLAGKRIEGRADRKPRAREPPRSPASTSSCRSAPRSRNITAPTRKASSTKAARKGMDRWMAVYAKKTEARTLADVIAGADIFLGLSAGGVLKPELLESMAEKPLIMALANPTPERSCPTSRGPCARTR